MSQATIFALGMLAFGLAALLIVWRLRLSRHAAEIAEANRRFQATFEQAAVGIAHLDTQGRWIRINRRFCEIAGYDREELLEKTVDDITHPDDRPLDNAERGAMIAGELDFSQVEKRYVRKDGNVVWVSATRSTVRDSSGEPEFFVAVVEEITARKEAEARLTSGEAQYRAIFDSAVEAIAVIDADGTIQSVNPAVERTFGYTPDELIGNNIRLLMPAAVARQHDNYLRRYRDTGEKAIIGIGREVEGRRKDGTVFPLDLSVAEWNRGDETFFTGIMRDISARKNAETALVAGEAQYRAIFDTAVEAMAVIDARGIIQSVNPAVERTFGYAPAELIGRNIKLLMPSDVASQHDFYLKRYRDTGRKAIIGIGREVIGQRKDGAIFPLDLSVAEWKRGDETFFTGVMRDISARKQAEQALLSSEERLRALQNEFAHLARVNDLGEMAAAIAHEINQPLAAIVNYLKSSVILTKQECSAANFEALAEDIGCASEQALRAGEIVRRLREFIGQGGGVRTIERVDRIVEAAMVLALIDARSSGIAARTEIACPDALVEVDTVQINQVLVNLLRNAIEAISAGPSAERVVTVSCEADDEEVSITVADTGPGIAPDVYERLFQPFVTSKSNGMGMGLSVSRRLIEAHGGQIGAVNREGGGAAFILRLPRYVAPDE